MDHRQLRTPPVDSVAAAVAIETGGNGTELYMVVLDPAITIVLRDTDGSGAIRFKAQNGGSDSIAFQFIRPIHFAGDVYTSAVGAQLYTE